MLVDKLARLSAVKTVCRVNTLFVHMLGKLRHRPARRLFRRVVEVHVEVVELIDNAYTRS